MIDPVYKRRKKAYDTVQDALYTNDIIDLRSNPLGPGAEALACGYVNDGNSVVLTTWTGSSWVRYIPSFDPANSELDSGKVLWVKLAFDENGTAYLMYARRSSGATAEYEIVIWHG
jgi:hypothetical protein